MAKFALNAAFQKQKSAVGGTEKTLNKKLIFVFPHFDFLNKKKEAINGGPPFICAIEL